MKTGRGMVVSAHRLASEAGAAVLRKGGNAFDAAVVTSLMLGVVEPAFSGIGGGGLALVHTASGETKALDYRETAPLGSSPGMFEAGSDRNRIGPLAVATPGLLAGHARMLEEFGTMKFCDLARPAIEAANRGVPARRLSRKMLLDPDSGVAEKLGRFRTSAEVFLGKDRFPLLAKTLETLAKEGPGGFYRSPVSASIARHLRELGGVVSEEDFSRYALREREPVRGEYRGYEVVSMPPPSAGGTLLLRGLGIAEELDGWRSKGGRPGLGIMAAVLEAMLVEKWRFGDPAFTDVPVAALLSRASLRKKAGEIGSRRAELPRGSPTDAGSTSHFCVVDGLGNAVAATETIECYYGSGVTVPDLGVILNDEMHDFDATPGKPNSVEPLKRPASSMSPTILLRDGSPFLVLGGAGSERIISSVFQVVTDVIDGEMSLAAALEEPRVHPAAGVLMAEGGLSRSALAQLRTAGREVRVRKSRDVYFGGVQAIVVDPDSKKVVGAADPRRQGAAVRA